MVMTKPVWVILLLSNLFLLSLASRQDENQRLSRGPINISYRNRDEDLITASGSVPVADYKVQSVIAPRSRSSNKEYGYPYRIAPTLGPLIHSKSNDHENEAELRTGSSAVSKAKNYGARLSSPDGIENIPTKKSYLKKQKSTYRYGASRRQDDYSSEEISAEKELRNYKIPNYRNYDELEKDFRPRRIDPDRADYFDFSYSPKPKRPDISPIDPYLTPSAGPTDSFIPSVPKVKQYGPYKTSSHSSYGKGPKYTYSTYEDEPPTKYRPGGGHYGYHDSYSIERNKPIIGDIRKRLLDYAGAPDMYEGEPDYLREVALNKNKYGYIGNYYHPYGGSRHSDSARDFRYAASKGLPIIVEKTLLR